MDGRKWYKYKDKCPGCGTEFLRKERHAHLACVKCGFMVSAPSYWETDRRSNFLKHFVDGVDKEITIEEYCQVSRLVITEVERLPAFV
ncbi:MAG: hypothetical protein ABIG65_02095 [Patescibacteria group bacterium]